MKCRAKTKLGRSCRAPALSGGRKCILHSADNKARELGARGGRGRAARTFELTKFPVPATAIDARMILGTTINEIREGKLDLRVGKVLASLANAFVRAVEIGDLELRITKLEQRDFGAQHGRLT